MATQLPAGDDGWVAFEHSPQATLLCEKDRIIRANIAAGKLLGVDPDSLSGETLLDQVGASGRSTFQNQRLSDPDGHVEAPLRAEASWHIASFRFSKKLPDGSQIVVIEDLTSSSSERRTVRRRGDRDEELERLEQMNQFKTQLLNTAAHELNTPLTPLRLQIHLLGSENLGRLSERQKKALSVLERNVERLAVLVSDVLDVARLESGHLTVELDSVDLSTIIKEASQAYEESAKGMGVSLLLDEGDDIVVKADTRRIMQVLYNLVSNGLKFTEAGGRVTIRTRTVEDEAVIEIIDTGLGMNADQLSRLYQPFSRVHDEEGTAISGTGLGLYICKGIVEQHGGQLEASSPGPGKGSTFTLRLPLASAPAMPRQQEAPKSALVVGPLAQRLRELI